MSMGSFVLSREGRPVIHSASFHSYFVRSTTHDAVSGGASIPNANGSVLTRAMPSRVRS